MVQATCTKFISDAFQDAIYAAGFSSLIGLADPKAMAVATLAGRAAARCYNAVWSPLKMSEEQKKQSPLENTLITVLSVVTTVGAAYYAGKLAGQYINPSFNYLGEQKAYWALHLAGGCLLLALGKIEIDIRKSLAPQIENSQVIELSDNFKISYSEQSEAVENSEQPAPAQSQLAVTS